MGLWGLTSKRGDKTTAAIFAAFVGNLVIALFKLAAAILSGSSAMVAETAHSFADTGNQLILLLGLRLSKKPPDLEHPFGYGMERYFWPFMAAMSMFVIGATFSIVQGVLRLQSDQEISALKLSYSVLAIAVVFDSYSLSVAWRGVWVPLKRYGLLRAIRRTKDPTLFTIVLEDLVALAGVGLAFFGILLTHFTGLVVFDAAASILIGVLLGAAAILLGYESRSLLIGEAASPETQQQIIRAVKSIPEVTDIVEMLTLHLAPDDILVNLDLHLKDGLTTDNIEATVDRIEEEIRKTVPHARRIFIECETFRRARRSVTETWEYM